jgi:hypothetical protein
LLGWQYLFIIEGSLTMFVALLAFLLLPNQPGSAWFLSPAEREYAAQRIRIDNERYVLKEYGATDIHEVSQRLTKRDIIETAKDWKLWSVLICNICASVPSQAFGVFLPVVVQGMGYSSNQANLVSCFIFASTLLLFLKQELQQGKRLPYYLWTYCLPNWLDHGYHY